MKNSLYFLCSLLFVATLLPAQTGFDLSQTLQSHARKLGRSRPLTELPQLPRPYLPAGEPIREIPNFQNFHPVDASEPDGFEPDGALQQAPGNGAATTLLINVAGISRAESGPVIPPDPTGDVGKDHYVQMTNSSDGAVFIVLDKQGQRIYGPAALNDLWQEFGVTGHGDGIVLYDQQYQRWMLAEFTDFISLPNRLLLAVSVSSDPLGAWEAYEIQPPYFPDYPKYALWGDALIITTNEMGNTIPAYAVHREELFTLQAAPRIQRLAGIPKFGVPNFFEVATPVDVEGTTAPANDGPALVLRLADNTLMGGDDRVDIYETRIDWDNPGNSSVSLAQSVPLAAFSLQICSVGQGCLSVPNSTLNIAALSGILMNRATYRNLGIYESLLLNFTVFTGDEQGAVRWTELRRIPGGNSQWEVFQQSTFAPDEHHRWMGSIAQDGAGNMALGYTIMGPGVKPSLRITGRNHDDFPGLMNLAETEIASGLVYPKISHRWGDYFNMSVDPEDDKTFWFTGEYLNGSGDDAWATQIAAFHILQDLYDIGPIGLLSPVASDSIASAEQVRVRIYNYGSELLDNFKVGFALDNQPPVVETVNITVAPGTFHDYTFSPTIDLSAFGPYLIRVFTALPGDQSTGNDTLRSVVRHLTRNDAGVTAVLGVAQPLCPSADSLELLVKNFGAWQLNSVQLRWKLGNGPWQIQDLVLSLAPGASTSVHIPVALQPGVTQLTAVTALPNGVDDEGPVNDTLLHLIQVLNGKTIRVELTTDAKPTEVYWYLIQPNGQILKSSMGSLQQAHYKYVYSWCLASGACYYFNITDTGANGLASGTPPGDLKIFDDYGNLLYALPFPDFGQSLVVPICLDLDCAGFSALAEIQPPSSLLSNDGEVTIHASGGVPPYTYSAYGPNSYQADSVFNNLPYTTLSVYVKDASGCVFALPVSIQYCSMEASLSVTKTPPGSAAGQISIEVVGGNPPFLYFLDNGAPQANPVFTGLTAGYHSVCVRDKYGCQECFFAVIETTTAAAEPEAGVRLAITPNPASTVARIEASGIPDLERLPFRLIGANGRVLLRSDLVRWGDTLVAPLDVLWLPAGIYFIRLTALGLERTVQLIVGP